MWKDHFMSLYNSVPDGGARSLFQQNCVTVENVDSQSVNQILFWTVCDS